MAAKYKLLADAVEAMRIPPKEEWVSDQTLAGQIYMFIKAPAGFCQVTPSQTSFSVNIWLNTKGYQFVSPKAGEWLVKLPDPFSGVRLVVVAAELFGALFVHESQTPKSQGVPPEEQARRRAANAGIDTSRISDASRRHLGVSDPADEDWGGEGWHQGGTGNYPTTGGRDWFERRD